MLSFFRIHSQGNPISHKNHPDSRAIFFEEKTYSKRKIQDFLLALSGLEKLQKGLTRLKQEEPKTSLLQTIAESPDLTPLLSYFQEVFLFN